jgi:hypothetical protein
MKPLTISRIVHGCAGMSMIGALMGILSIGTPALGYNILNPYPPRAVVRDGTMKTHDNQLLRGTTLHVSKGMTSRASPWGLNKANLIRLRDEGHLNVIRLNCLDPRAIIDGRPTSAFSTILEEATTYTDSIVENCGAVGLYVLLDYHCMGMVWDNSTWDIRNFWRFYGPRYKDKTWVMYEMENEVYQDCPTDLSAGAWPTAGEAEIYKIARSAAPNTIIATGMEPLCVKSDWSNYLKNGYGKAAGIDWTAGKDVWPWHDYSSCTASGVLATKNGGVPVICTEFSYAEDGWYNTSLDGSKNVCQWCEKPGVQISWIDWKSWNAADQACNLAWLIPDATSKGYAWWTTPSQAVEKPKASVAKKMDFTAHAATMIQANGRMLPDQMRDEKRDFQLYIFPLNSMRP